MIEMIELYIVTAFGVLLCAFFVFLPWLCKDSESEKD